VVTNAHFFTLAAIAPCDAEHMASSTIDSRPAQQQGGFPEESAPTPEIGGGAARLALRLHAGVDADRLESELARLWEETGPRRRGRGVELSVVETCGRNPADRERDAMRLLRLEADRSASGSRTEPLRATLVSLDSADHLLLIAAPAACGAAVLSGLVAGLSRLYPFAAA
jgi:hypothetical protein